MRTGRELSRRERSWGNSSTIRGKLFILLILLSLSRSYRQAGRVSACAIYASGTKFLSHLEGAFIIGIGYHLHWARGFLSPRSKCIIHRKVINLSLAPASRNSTSSGNPTGRSPRGSSCGSPSRSCCAAGAHTRRPPQSSTAYCASTSSTATTTSGDPSPFFFFRFT